MNYSLTSLILVLSFSLFFFAFSLLFGRFSFKKKQKENFSFTRDFVFELFQNGQYPENFIARWAYWAYLAIVIFTSYFYLLPFFSQPKGLFYLSLIICIVIVFKCVTYFFLSFIPAYYHKPHVILATLAMSFSALNEILGGLFMINFSYYEGILKNVMGILSMVLGVIELILMLIPNFSDWTKYQKNVDQEGNEIVIRPKFFILAFGEWITLFLDFLSYLLLLIAFFSFA